MSQLCKIQQWWANGTVFINNSNNNNNPIQRHNSSFFYNLLTAPRTVSTYSQVAQAQSCANHVQHSERLSRASDRVMRHVVRRDSSAIKFDRVEIAFIWAFIFFWLNNTGWRRGGNGSTQRKPLGTSFRKCHILKPEDSSPKRDSNPHNSLGGRLGKQTC